MVRQRIGRVLLVFVPIMGYNNTFNPGSLVFRV
jgi:hypothetical protein